MRHKGDTWVKDGLRTYFGEITNQFIFNFLRT